jgi:hypothetical protein
VTIILLYSPPSFNREYIIYNISQDLPMGEEGEIIKKNYYVSMGKLQGIDKGAILDVHRAVSVIDPYKSKNRYNYKIKIGEVKIIHTEENTSIAAMSKIEKGEDTPVFEVDNLMIGDSVTISVDE